MLIPNNIDDKARKIQEIINELGWNADLPSLVERVKQMDNGLVQEDEFIYVLNWSEKCSLIHKLDQLHIPPNSKSQFTIPDIFVVFKDNDKEYPYYIEIKTSKEGKLSWTEKYYQGLLNYSKITGIPILVAWKWRSLDIWTLFEIKHFKKNVKNYKISMEDAHMQNLMSKFAGDFLIVPYDEIALHFKFRKEKEVHKKENETTWETVCESIFMTGDNNKEITEIDPEIFAFFITLSLDEVVSETDTHIIYKYIPSLNKSTFAQSIPVRLAMIFSDVDVNWLTKIKKQEFSVNYTEFLASINNNIEKGLIRNTFIIQPKSDSKIKNM